MTNLHGHVNTDGVLGMAENLREDADLLETAYEKMEAGEWEPEEAALYIAENANYGDYDTHDHLYDNIPIQEES